MELTLSQSSPVLTDSTLGMSKSMLGIQSGLLPYPQSSNIYVTIPRKTAGILENGWLDAMKSSSPPPNKLTKDSSIGMGSDALDINYHSWMLKYPSALKSFRQIANRAKGKKIAVFLDYDGTLSPIVDDPDCAFMSDPMRCALRNVSKYFPTAIISGRSRDKVNELVGLSELYYAGSHGMDIKGPPRKVASNGLSHCIKTSDNEDVEVNLFQPASEFLPMINEVFEILVENTKGIPGAKVENHKFCTSVHYRNVEEKWWPTVAQRVYDILKRYPRLRLTHGRKVLEVRPVIEWNKGKAVEFLLNSLGVGESEDVLPIYVGDDSTDEDAFKLLGEGNRGCGILVSRAPKDTNASYSLRDPSEVMEFLNSLVSWKKRQCVVNS